MGSRRKARELALQALFYVDSRQEFSKDLLEQFYACFAPARKPGAFFRQVAEGVVTYRTEIDSVMARYSSNWKLDRMSRVDRNALRIAVYEMLFCDDIPMKVSINEAIDMGKKFGSEDSGAFINGILDSIRCAIEDGDELYWNERDARSS